MRPQKNDSGVSNPIGAAEFHGFVNRICEGTEQIRPMNNIKIVDKKVVQNNQGTMCYRCINNCPKQAMTLLGKKVVGQSVIEKYLLCFQVYNGK